MSEVPIPEVSVPVPVAIGQYYKGRYHHKVILVLEVHEDRATVLAELQVPSGGGRQWVVQWETLARSYKLLEGYEVSSDTACHWAQKLNVP